MYAQYGCPRPKTSVHWAPLYIGHFGQVPLVPNVERSDCIQFMIMKLTSPTYKVSMFRPNKIDTLFGVSVDFDPRR